MIVSIGCDIVEHEITSHLDWFNDPKTLKRIFSKPEIEKCPANDQERYYSGRFAIKEAILKCLGTGMEDGISLSNIETSKTDCGSVKVLLNGKVKKIAEEKDITDWHISLSHSSHSSIAFVVAENRNE